MKKLILLLVAILTLGLSANAQEMEQYAIVALAANPNLESFNCKSMQEVRLVSTPIAIPQYDQVVKWNLTYQFLDWIYKNDKTKLDLIAGYTKVNFHTVLYAKTEEEVKQKAQKYGLYSTRSNCGPKKKAIYTFEDIKYKNEKLDKERQNYLREYINKDN